MSCKHCENIVERRDVPHVIRNCPECGRELHIYEPGKHGVGFKIKKGDRPVIPENYIKMSLNPLENRGQFTLYGLEWLMTKVFFGDFPQRGETLDDEIAHVQELCNTIVIESNMFKGLDITDEKNAEEIKFRFDSRKNTPEWWALMGKSFAEAAQHALADGDAKKTAWSVAGLERSRLMLLYKQHLEEVMWVAHSVTKILALWRTWEGNQKNCDEGFWQQQFKENSYALSQIFAVPALFIQDGAYVGGMTIDRKNAKLLDFLYKVKSSQDILLIKIKTPCTNLIYKTKYRGIFGPSRELSSSVVQALDYRHELISNIKLLATESGIDLRALNPRCVLIAGNGSHDLDDEAKRKSFELFRSSHKNIEIITYDELFEKIFSLAKLFGLVKNGESRSSPKQG